MPERNLPAAVLSGVELVLQEAQGRGELQGSAEQGHGQLTRHSTKVAQDGPCVIGEDGEVPSMPVEESRGVRLVGKPTTMSPEHGPEYPSLP